MDGTQLVSSRAHAYACKLLSICRMAALDACQPALAQRHQNCRIAARSAAAVIISMRAQLRKCVRAPAPGRASHMRHLYGMDMLCPGKARIARRRRGRGISSHPCARARGRTSERANGRTHGMMGKSEQTRQAAVRTRCCSNTDGLCEEVTSAPRYPPHYSNSYGAARTESGFGVRARVLRSWKRNDHLEGGSAFPELILVRDLAFLKTVIRFGTAGVALAGPVHFCYFCSRLCYCRRSVRLAGILRDTEQGCGGIVSAPPVS